METRLAAEERQARAERLRIAQLEDKVAWLRERAAQQAARSKVMRARGRWAGVWREVVGGMG